MAKRALLVAFVVAVLVTPTAATAEPPPVRVHIGRQAYIVQGGEVARIPVRARCPAGTVVLEGIVTVNQHGNEGEGFFSVPCDGAMHRTVAPVVAIDFVFQPGEVTASSLLLVEDPDTGETLEDQHSRSLQLLTR